MKPIIFSLFALFLSIQVYAQNTARESYIEKYKVTAVEKMLEYGIPASITLAQGILESGAGMSDLATQANNHFGIKCHKGWTGGTYIMDDDKKNECFRKYQSASASFEDHSLFLTKRDRYAFLFEYKVTDYKKWAHGLKKAGYATNPKYAHLLIKVIEESNLHQYDKIKNLREIGVGNPSKPLYEDVDVVATTAAINFKPVSVSANERLIYENQGVRYILALNGESYHSIAAEFEIYAWQLRKYNDAGKKTPVKAGDFIYIQKKNNKAPVRYHIVQRGETLRSICQKYAVRMNKVQKRNGIKGDRLREGERLKLQ